MTPNDFLQATPSGAYRFNTWSARVSSVYDAPFAIRLMPVLRYDEGQPFGRTLLANLNYGAVTLLTEPIGSRRQRPLALVDLRIEKVFRLRRRPLSGFVDCFNVLNANPERTLDWRSGEAFLAPRSVTAPRTMRVGVRFSW